ncbi:MAG: NAD(+) diphosphatase [Silicimonas sp.]|nr:NAD(+) diphosphatase [Silicimonas sp.]
MKHAERVTFGGWGLDRAAHLRRDPPSGDVLPFWRGKVLFDGDGEDRHPVFLSADHSVFDQSREPAVFLGLDDKAPRFARDISDWEPDDTTETVGAFNDPSEQHHPALGEGQRFGELRANMTRLSRRSAELVATGKAILEWHRTHRFCAQCGQQSQIAQGGWQRDCPACEAHHFPRTDPVVIMLITHGNSVLMGRSHFWPEGMYSLLAGFVEPGETIEAAVRREVVEESGIVVGEVSYLSSQPWPFPTSLMFGCHGHATSTEITIDKDEIEDAQWVTREVMMQALAGELPNMKPARKGSIARFLIEHWLADTLD